MNGLVFHHHVSIMAPGGLQAQEQQRRSKQCAARPRPHEGQRVTPEPCPYRFATLTTTGATLPRAVSLAFGLSWRLGGRPAGQMAGIGAEGRISALPSPSAVPR